jgi:hypothetical protein
MIWLTWRQFRAQTVVAAVALAGFAVILGVTGPNLAHAYAASGLASCRGNCTSLSSTFLSQVKSDSVYPLLYFVGGAALYLTPALIGIFWGAPLVSRELEAGTLRLTWNQSVTRTRWMAAKLGLVGLVAMATAGLLSLMVTWWSGPIDQAGGFPVTAGQLSRFSPLVFDARGFAPVGYVAFAFTLGVTVGVLTRRTLPAMAIVLACVAVVQLGWPTVVRPHLIPPATSTSTVSVDVGTARVGHEGELAVPVTGMPGAWIVSNQTITPAGKVFVLPDVAACNTGTQQQCNRFLATKHLRQRITYQPASRFWAFQAYETAIFVVLSLALAGFSVWRIRSRRLA